VYLSGTDIWSVTGKNLVRFEKAVRHQLGGDLTWWAGEYDDDEGNWGDRGLQDDLVSSGFGTDDLIGGPRRTAQQWEVTERLESRAALYGRLREILAEHEVEGDPYRYPDRPEWSDSVRNRYPYLEMKVVGIVPVSSLPVVLYARRDARRVNPLLDALGFKGFRVPFTWTGGRKVEHDDAERRRWASTVTDAIQAWAAAPCNRRLARGGSAVSWQGARSGYDPTLTWERSMRSWRSSAGSCGAGRKQR